MDNRQRDGEIQLYDAVKDLTQSDIAERVTRNASTLGIDVKKEHMEVIESLIEHYKNTCQTQDCHAASPHMRFLIDTFEEKGGSKYLYQLFDQSTSVDEVSSKNGILTLIHRLLDLPGLTYNRDEGFGTVV